MQVSISCRDGDFPAVPFVVTEDTLVSDAIEAASDEWGAGFQNCKLCCEGKVLPMSSKLVSHGIEGGAQLEVLKELLGWSIEDMNAFEGTIEELLQFCDDEGFLPVNTQLFVSQELELRNPTITSLSFVNGHAIIDFNSRAVRNMKKVKRVKFPGLYNVRTIGDNFISGFPSLTDINLSGLCNVEVIGERFLYGAALRAIDLSPLVNLQHLGDNALNDCHRLSSINFSLPRLKSIPYQFFSFSGNCHYPESELDRIDLSCLRSVTHIGKDFLSKHNALQEVEFGTAMGNVSHVDECFLSRAAVEALDFSSFTSLTDISRNFLWYCKSLKSVDLSGLQSLRTIGRNFLVGCSNITELDLSMLVNTISIGDDFLSACSSLKCIDLSGLVNIVSLGNRFLSRCTSLVEIDLSKLTSLTEVGDSFLIGCCSLRSVSFDGLSSLTNIGEHGLEGCSSLYGVDERSLRVDCCFKGPLFENTGLWSKYEMKFDRRRTLQQVREAVRKTQTQALCAISNSQMLEKEIQSVCDRLAKLESAN